MKGLGPILGIKGEGNCYEGRGIFTRPGRGTATELVQNKREGVKS